MAKEHRLLAFGQKIDKGIVSRVIDDMRARGSLQYLDSGNPQSPYVRLSEEEIGSLTKIGGTD